MLRFHSGAFTLLVGIGSLLAMASFAPAAAACSLPAAGWWASLIVEQVPSDGFVPLSYYCHRDCGSGQPPPVVARNAVSGLEVEGELTYISGEGDHPQAFAWPHVFVWRAAAPLVEGEYEMDLPSQSLSANTGTFRVVPSEKPNLRDLAIDVRAEPMTRDEGPSVCCPGEPLDTCGGSICYTPLQRRWLEIGLDWSQAENGAPWAQYLHRVIGEGAETEPKWELGLHTWLSFTTQRSEYCYTLEFKSLVDGTIERLERTCVPHPATETLGVVQRANARQSLGACVEPPEGLTKAWCAARAESCARYPTGTCQNLKQLCPADPEPQGTGGSPAMDPQPTAPPESRGGCSLSPRSAQRGAGVWAAALAAILLALRRGRARA